MLRLISTVSRFHRRSNGQSAIVTAANFAAFLIASSGAFLPQNDMLLIGNDGEYTRDLTIQFFRFSDSILGLPMAPFEGMGTLFSFNPMLTPSLIPLPLLGDAAGKWLGFLICVALLFVSTYALGRALGMRQRVSLLAAWLLPPLCVPYQSWINLYLTFNLNPLAGDTISALLFLLALLARGYTSARPLWPALGVLSIVVWLFVTNPLWLAILLPTALAVSIGIIGSHVRQRNFIGRTALLALPSIAFVALGGAPYLLGLYEDTAATLFAGELNHGQAFTWRLSTVATAVPLGSAWVGLALIGLALVVFRERGTLRAMALSVLVAIGFLAAYIAAYGTSPSWALPYPIYFEFALWPFYALLAAYAVAEIAGFLVAWFCYRHPRSAEPLLRAPLPPRQQAGLLILGGAILCILLAENPFLIRPNDLILPPTDTAITKALQADSGISPDAPFRGYMATLSGFQGPGGPPTNWLGVLADSNAAILNFGNAHRVPYLWRSNIATIESYAQNVEPAVYGVITRLLDRPGDGQVRGVTIVTQTNFALMESLGLHFLITDFALPEPARLTAKVVTPRMSHFLFELPDPNYANYSPTEVVSAQDANDVLLRISATNFDFRKTVVLDEPLDQAFIPAEHSRAILVPGGWRIQARSAGVSLLLVPMQFSECLSVTEHDPSGGRVISIRRANLTSTALIFEGAIDAELKAHVSPFWKPFCRLHDASEMRAFGLATLPANIRAARPTSTSSGN
jgi:hypothetical protein